MAGLGKSICSPSYLCFRSFRTHPVSLQGYLSSLRPGIIVLSIHKIRIILEQEKEESINPKDKNKQTTTKNNNINLFVNLGPHYSHRLGLKSPQNQNGLDSGLPLESPLPVGDAGLLGKKRQDPGSREGRALPHSLWMSRATWPVFWCPVCLHSYLSL